MKTEKKKKQGVVTTTWDHVTGPPQRYLRRRKRKSLPALDRKSIVLLGGRLVHQTTNRKKGKKGKQQVEHHLSTMEKRTCLKLSFLLLSLVCQARSDEESDISCKGHQNEAVDWFIVYKMPRIKEKTASKVFQSGGGMMYMDSSKPEWEPLEKNITTTAHPIYYTLKQVYASKKTKDIVYLMYNDKTPKQITSSSKAHAKGDLYFDSTSGFWLIHSVPSFPPEPSTKKYAYPASGTIYGQTLICVTFGTDQLNLIGTQLRIMNPQLYGYYVSKYFKTVAPEIWSLLVKESKVKKPKVTNNTVSLKSRGGTRFVSFSKSRRFGKDLYLDLVAPGLKCNLLVESWMNGLGDFPSTCRVKYTVRNVVGLNMEGMEFKESQDHSKWAITDLGDGQKNLSKGEDKTWVCVGDINRQESQAIRGGGTLCFDDLRVWKEFRKLIVSVEECSGKEKPV